MVVTDSDSRRNKVLRVIIDAHVETAAPVSSEYVCSKSGLGFSPATIRNIMAELEKLGHLTHPHTSAGRIPTDKGYRYYVNELMDAYELNESERSSIEQNLAHVMDWHRGFAMPMSRFLSGSTRQLAIILDRDDFRFMGLSNMLEYPEFQDADYSKQLLRRLEEQDELIEILREDLEKDEISIHIGSENRCCELQRCSMVVAPYKVKSKAAGAISVLGPTRMAYSELAKRVGYMAQIAGEFLSR